MFKGIIILSMLFSQASGNGMRIYQLTESEQVTAASLSKTIKDTVKAANDAYAAYHDYVKTLSNAHGLPPSFILDGEVHTHFPEGDCGATTTLVDNKYLLYDPCGIN